MTKKEFMVLSATEIKSFETEDKATGKKYFEFQGYLSTFGNVDLGQDVCVRGCFEKSLKERKPKLLYQHDWDEPVGIFTEIYEDEKGLFVKGKMPMSDVTVSGKIAPQMEIGSIDSMSIGYYTKVYEMDSERGIRYLKEVVLLEGSIVTFPMNPEARVEYIKTLNKKYTESEKIADFPILDISEKWDAEKASERVKELENLPALPVFDCVEGKAVVNPRACFALKAGIIGAKGGFKGDVDLAKSFLNEYYEKMGLDAPFKEGREITFCETEIKNIPLAEMAFILRNGKLSKSCSDYLARKALQTETPDESGVNWEKALKEFNERLEKEIKGITN